MTGQLHRITVSRRARYYSLGDLAGAADLWVVVHGYGQLAADFIESFAPLATAGRAVVAPEALNRYYKAEEPDGSHANAPVGATWMTREDRETEIADYVDYLDAVAAAVGAAGRARVTALGFSQGVATVSRWVARGRTVVQRLVLWAGALPTDVDLPAAGGRFPPGATHVVQGSRDRFAGWADGDGLRDRLAAARIAARLHRFEGGHRLDRETLLSIADD